MLIEVSKEDEEKAREIMKDAREFFKAKRMLNGRAFIGQGNGLQYDGVLAELVVARYFKAKHNDINGFDKGVDLTLPTGLTVDVKTIRRDSKYLLEFPNDIEKKLNDAYFIATWFDGKIKLLAWIRRDLFIQRARTGDFGYGKRLFMNKNEMNQDFEVFKEITAWD